MASISVPCGLAAPGEDSKSGAVSAETVLRLPCKKVCAQAAARQESALHGRPRPPVSPSVRVMCTPGSSFLSWKR